MPISRLSQRLFAGVSVTSPSFTHHYKALSPPFPKSLPSAADLNRIQVRFKGDTSEAQRAWTGREEEGRRGTWGWERAAGPREQKRRRWFPIGFSVSGEIAPLLLKI